MRNKQISIICRIKSAWNFTVMTQCGSKLKYWKGKSVPVYTMMVYKGSRCTAPLILNLSTRWRWVVNFIHQAATSLGNNHSTYWVRGCRVSKYGMDILDKRKCLAHAGICFLHHRTNNLSPYQVRYPGSTGVLNHGNFTLISSLLTYSMVQSPSWAADWLAASQEIPRISRNPKVHYRTHKRTPPDPILGQPNPVQMPTSHLLEIHPIYHH